ncbi:permease [Chloroflexota bacterium]
MLIPTIVMGILAAVLLFIAYQRGGGEHMLGLKAASNLLLQVLPLLIFAFIIAGIAQYLIPTEVLSHWVGQESGFRGILIGTAIGGFMPGGPTVCLPIVAGLARLGASVGTMVALLTSWSLLAVARIPMEIGIMGWKFWLIRLACTFFFPPIAGLIADTLFSGVKLI